MVRCFIILLMIIFCSTPGVAEECPPGTHYHGCHEFLMNAGFGSFEVVATPGKGLIARESSSKKLLWALPTWIAPADYVAPKDHSDYLVTRHPENKLPLSATEKTPILTVWKKGTKHAEVLLGQVIKMGALRKAGFGDAQNDDGDPLYWRYEWGYTYGFAAPSKWNLYRFGTNEGKEFDLDVETGKLSPRS